MVFTPETERVRHESLSGLLWVARTNSPDDAPMHLCGRHEGRVIGTCLLHQDKRKQSGNNALQRNREVFVAADFPDFSMESEVGLVKSAVVAVVDVARCA